MNLNFRHSRNFRYLKQGHLLMCILVGTLLSQNCSSQIKLDSRWSPEQINIDGDESDWQGALTYVDGKKVSIGIKNDGEFLYVCLVSTDRMLQRQMRMRGFTAWFDPDGGTEKTFGIRFPIGMMFSGRGRDGDPESRREDFSRSPAELELLWPEEEKQTRLPIANDQGITAALGDRMDKLVYEIKVPLQKGDNLPYAIGISDGKHLGMGLETEEIDRGAMRERMGRGGSGGGRRGGGGGRGGFGGSGGGRGGAGQRPQMPKPFKLWFSFQLGREGEPISGEIFDIETSTTSEKDSPKSERRDRWENDGAPNVGEIAPTFILKSLDGKSETDLESFREQKPVVLFFGSYT